MPGKRELFKLEDHNEATTNGVKMSINKWWLDARFPNHQDSEILRYLPNVANGSKKHLDHIKISLKKASCNT